MDNKNIKKIITDNLPLLDELIYYLKIEMMSSVLKNENEALKYETLESAKTSNIYMTCVEGKARKEIFHYSNAFYYDYLAKYTEPIIYKYIHDPDSLPQSTINSIVADLSKYYMKNYVELNNYYRILNGKPPLDENFNPEASIYLTEDLIPRDLKGLDISIPLDQLSKSQLDILNQLGVIDKLKALYPDKEYLNYLGSKSIDIYAARISANFSLLSVSTAVPDVVYDLYREKVELNRVFTIKTVYSEAYKFQSDYYDNFIMIFILVQTYVDILADMPGMIIRKDIFDRRTVQLLFETNGIDYFPEIPLKYQIAMIRNLNSLLQYKATDKVFIDICSLFGFDNIIIFKYYLLKERVSDEISKRFIYSEKEIQDPNDPNKTITTEDLDKDFKLKFVKVPTGEILDDYLHDNSKVRDYDDIVLSDKYWQGDRTYDEVKADILNLEFNHYQSKYISIDTMYDMAEMSFQITYFFNMIFDNVDMEEQLTLQIPYISGETYTYKFVDIICYLLSLGALYQDMEDSIMDSRSKILHVKGFNFRADMEALSQYIANKGFTAEDLGIDNFQFEVNQVLTYEQLMYIFTTNKNIYDHVVDQIFNADNKRIYDAYYKIYESLMIEDLTFDFFKLPDGSIAKTFKEFLQYRDPVLYNSIVELESLTDKVDRNSKISDLIENCVYVIEASMDLSQYKFIFSHLPVVSAESVKIFIYKVINFFKSYKVQIESINTIYIFDDKMENKIKMIDEAIITHHLTKTDVIHYMSKIKNTVHLNPIEKSNILDNIDIQINRLIEKYFHEMNFIKDDKSLKSKLNYLDYGRIYDNKLVTSKLYKEENIFSKEESLTITRTS